MLEWIHFLNTYATCIEWMYWQQTAFDPSARRRAPARYLDLILEL